MAASGGAASGTSQGPVSIPRTLHYCWFGGAPKPPLVQRCMESWRTHMPDWDIVEWNEANYDVGACEYARQAHERGLWAFVSDYARFDVLSRCGGVYLDTDVELLKPIPEWVLQDSAFISMDPAGIVNPGQIMGAVKDTPILAELLHAYQAAQFIVEGRPVLLTVNYRMTEILERHGYVRKDVTQFVAGVKVHSSEYFCGYDTDIHEPLVTANTISVHHGAHSWGGRGELIRRNVQRLLRGVIGTSRYRRLLVAKRMVFGIRGATPAPDSASREDVDE